MKANSTILKANLQASKISMYYIPDSKGQGFQLWKQFKLLLDWTQKKRRFSMCMCYCGSHFIEDVNVLVFKTKINEELKCDSGSNKNFKFRVSCKFW